jgi:hypothetical protein
MSCAQLAKLCVYNTPPGIHSWNIPEDKLLSRGLAFCQIADSLHLRGNITGHVCRYHIIVFRSHDINKSFKYGQAKQNTTSMTHTLKIRFPSSCIWNYTYYVVACTYTHEHASYSQGLVSYKYMGFIKFNQITTRFNKFYMIYVSL